MKLKITRTKKIESVTVEYNRMTENRKETQLDVNFELSDVSESLIKFLKKHL